MTSVWTLVRSRLVRLFRLRRPGRADLPALASAAVLLVFAAPALGGWGTAFCAFGALAVASSDLRWPATPVAAAVVATVAVEGRWLLVVGLLTAAYLVLLYGVPPLDGLAALGAGVGIAIAVTVLALAVEIPASIWWVLPTAVAVPLLLALVAGPRAGRSG